MTLCFAIYLLWCQPEVSIGYLLLNSSLKSSYCLVIPYCKHICCLYNIFHVMLLSTMKNQVRKTIANRLWIASMCTLCINIIATSVYRDLFIIGINDVTVAAFFYQWDEIFMNFMDFMTFIKLKLWFLTTSLSCWSFQKQFHENRIVKNSLEGDFVNKTAM